MEMTRLLSLLALVATLSPVVGFAPVPVQKRCSTAIQFGIPTFGAKDTEKQPKYDGQEGAEEKKIGFSGLLQLITAGMGSPFLGQYEGVDPETGRFMFSLEANNLVDKVSIHDL